MGRLQTSIGLITGTNIVGTVDQLIAISGRSRDRLVAQTKDLQSQQTAITELTALVIGVQFAGKNLNTASQYQARQATSSNAAALSVSAETSAELGAIKARATQIASTQAFQSKGLTTDTDASLGFTGSINLRAGGFINSSVSVDKLNQGRGIDRGAIRITDRSGKSEDIDLSKATTIDEVINTINNASTVRVRATTVGDSIQLTDLTGATASNLRVTEVGDGETAADLGLYGIDVANASATGTDIFGDITDTTPSGLQGVSLSKLAGGQGVGALTSINITATNGTTTNVDLSSATTTQDIIRLINASGAPVEARINESSTGFRIRDLSGGSSNAFSISSTDNTAQKLGIAQSSSSRVIEGSSLEGQVVASDTKLSSLRQGRGVDAGSFRITNSQGAGATINLSDAATATVDDLIDRINASGISVTASINSTGDGIAIVDTSNGSGSFTIANTGTDTTAADLGFNVAAKSAVSGNTTTRTIEARQADSIAVDAGDSLEDIVDKFNTTSKFATASITTLDDGKKAIAIRSARGGDSGRLSVTTTGLDLGFQTTVGGKDAILEIEQADGSKRQLRSSDGVFKDVTAGVSLTAKETTSEFVNIEVARDTKPAVSNIKALVTQYNKVVDRLDALTVFNQDSGEVGLLFGTTEALRIETSYTRVLSGQIFGAGSFKSIGELGLGFNDKGQLELNETKLTEKLNENGDAVTEFLTKKDTGLIARLDSVAERIAGINNSLLLSKNGSLNARIQRNTEQTESMNLRLNNERERLLKQYFAAEQAISKLQSNQSYLSQIQSIANASNQS
jgi:flagellar hook-associated protein 2